MGIGLRVEGGGSGSIGTHGMDGVKDGEQLTASEHDPGVWERGGGAKSGDGQNEHMVRTGHVAMSAGLV